MPPDEFRGTPAKAWQDRMLGALVYRTAGAVPQLCEAPLPGIEFPPIASTEPCEIAPAPPRWRGYANRASVSGDCVTDRNRPPLSYQPCWPKRHQVSSIRNPSQRCSPPEIDATAYRQASGSR